MLVQCPAGTSSTNPDQLVGSCSLVWPWKQLKMVSFFYMWVETGIADECETSTNIICCQSFATWYVLEGDNKFLTILQLKQHQSDCKEKKSDKITVDVDICSTQSYVKYISCSIQVHTLTVTLRPRRAATKKPSTIGSEKSCSRGAEYVHFSKEFFCVHSPTFKSLASATSTHSSHSSFLLYTQTKQTVYHSHVHIQDPANGSSADAAKAGITALVWAWHGRRQ